MVQIIILVFYKKIKSIFILLVVFLIVKCIVLYYIFSIFYWSLLLSYKEVQDIVMFFLF